MCARGTSMSISHRCAKTRLKPRSYFLGGHCIMKNLHCTYPKKIYWIQKHYDIRPLYSDADMIFNESDQDILWYENEYF